MRQQATASSPPADQVQSPLIAFPGSAEPTPVAAVRSKTPTLHHGVLSTLRDLIIHDELPPGTRLTESVLCERLHVSRTPLREALKVLAHEGLVEILPNRGALSRDQSARWYRRGIHCGSPLPCASVAHA